MAQQGDSPEGALPGDLPGQEGGASQAGATEGAVPQFVTREEVQALLEQGLKRVLGQSQSLVDKADARITARFQAELAAINRAIAEAQALGHEIPASVADGMRQRAMVRALTPQGAQGETPRGARAAMPELPEGVDPNDPMVAAAYEALAMMEEADCLIEENDPEFKLVDLKTKSAHKFLGSIERAIEAKRKRLSQKETSEEGAGEAQQTGPTSEARTRLPPQKGRGAVPLTNKSAMDLMREAYSRPSRR